jgi:hypothetical protein
VVLAGVAIVVVAGLAVGGVRVVERRALVPSVEPADTVIPEPPGPSDTELGLAAMGRADYPQALARFTTAARAGDATAQVWAGHLHERGLGTASSYRDAHQFYTLAVAQGDTSAARRLEQLERQRPLRDAVAQLDVRWRRSRLESETRVLQLVNRMSYNVTFDLKCYRQDGASLVMPVTVNAGSTKEIGFLEGWTGNFRAGERCEIVYQDIVLRSWTVEG